MFKKFISALTLNSYIFSFVFAPVYASAELGLPAFNGHDEHVFAQKSLLNPQFPLPKNFSSDQQQQVEFKVSIKDISYENQKNFFVSLAQQDKLISKFYLGTDFNPQIKNTQFVVPIIGTDDLLKGWSWHLNAYGLPSVQIRTDGAVIIDQQATSRYQKSFSIAAPAVHLGTYKARHLRLQSPEVTVHNTVDIENFEVESGQTAGSLFIGEKGCLRLKELLFCGNFVNLGSLFLDNLPGINHPLLRLQGSSVYNWGTIANDSVFRLADLSSFENFGKISARNFAVGALQFLNHQTISAAKTEIIAKNQFVNSVNASVTGTSDLQVVSLAEISNQGLLKGAQAYIAGQNFTGNGSIASENLKFFTNLWEGQGEFKSSVIEFSFQQLLSRGNKASFEGGRISLVSNGDNQLLTLATLNADNVHLELLGTDLEINKLELAQSAVFKTKNLAIKNVTPGYGEVEWQAEQKLELPAALVKFRNKTTLKAKILKFDRIQSPRSLSVDVQTLAGKSIQADSLDLIFSAIDLDPMQHSLGADGAAQSGDLPNNLYEYAAQQKLSLTCLAESFENRGHLQGKKVKISGNLLHNLGTIVAKQNTRLEGSFINAVEGIVQSPVLELRRSDGALNNAGKITVKSLKGIKNIGNTGHLEVLGKGFRLQTFNNSGYADLGTGKWFFEDFTNTEEAVCKLGKFTEVVAYKNAGALYANQGLKIVGNPAEGLGQVIIDDRAIWYVIPQEALLLSATGDEEKYLNDVSKENPVVGLIGFFGLSQDHPKRLLKDLSSEQTRSEWAKLLDHLGCSQDPLFSMQLLHQAKGQLWDHRSTPIYPDIPAVVAAIDGAIINILTGAWGLAYLNGIADAQVTMMDAIAAGVGKSFYQQHQMLQQLYQETYDAFSEHFMANQGVGKSLLQQHYKNTIKQIGSGYFSAQDCDGEIAQLIFRPASEGSLNLTEALQKSAIIAECLQVNYDGDFTNTADLSITSPLILRTKKFWNQGKISADLLLLCDEFTNGVDNDHLGEIVATQGSVNVYSQAKIDNRFGRIFSDGPSAIESLGGHVEVGSVKEIRIRHEDADPTRAVHRNTLVDPYYMKKILNGASIASNNQMRISGYFSDVYIDFGEIFANQTLSIRSELVRSTAGLVRTRQSAYFYGLRYLSTRPDQIWYHVHNDGDHHSMSYLWECADASETAALEDIWFNMPQVDIEQSNLMAGKGVYKLNQLLAGYGKEYQSGLNLVSRIERSRGAIHGQLFGHLGNTISSSLTVGEDIFIQGPEGITISGNVSAGGKINIDVENILTRCLGNSRSRPSENFLVIDLHEVAKAQTGGFFALQDNGQVDALYPITSNFSWTSLDLACVGSKQTSAVSETAFEFALQKALAQSVGHLSFEEQSSMALQEYLFRNSSASGGALSLDELVAKATKPLVAMVARQVQSTLFSIPHLLVPANFVNPYQASGDVYGKQVHLLTSGDQTHESSRIVAKKEFEARAKGKINRYTAKYAEVSYGDLSVTVTEKAKPQQQFICEEGSLAAVSTQDYQEIGCATEACGNMLRGSLDANASFGALELHTKTVTTETRSGGFFSGPKTIVTTSESSNFLANKAYSGGNSQIIGKNVSQVGVEEHAGDELVYKSGQLVLDAAVGINRTQTTATTKGAFSTRTQKSLMEMPVFVRNLLSAQTIRFEGQDSANIRGAAITADTVMDQTKKGATFGPTVSAMRYEISDSTRTPMAATNHGTRGGQELMAPTAFNVRRIVRSASFDGVSPGKMEFVSCVWQARERVEILGKYQESVYILKKWQESWAHHHQVIPNEAISVLAIAVSLSTQGIGSAFFTNTLGFSSLGATMGSAGLKYLISSAATSLAQTGDLEGTLKNLASDRALRGLAISIASAGLTQKLAGICEIPLDTKSLELIDHVKAEGLRAGVTTAVTLAISKDDPSDILRQGLMSFAGNTLGAFGASHIGAWYKGTDHSQTWGFHKILHGLNGGVMGFLLDGTTKGFVSGAIGAVATETIVEARNDYLAERAMARIQEAKQAGDLGPEKIKELDLASKEDFAETLRTAQLSSAALAAILGQDAVLASHGGAIAATHNWEPTIGAIIGLGFAAWGVYEVYDTYRTHGPDAAIQKLVVMGVISAATFGTGYVIGTVFYPSAAAAWAGLMANYPKYASMVAKITGSKAAQTLGKVQDLYGAANAKLASAAQKVGLKGAKPVVKVKAHEAEDVLSKPHGNSLDYAGDTHVYVIRDANGKIHKVGESMQGTNALGQSKRAEAQVKKLKREGNGHFESEIRRDFSTKAEARAWETELIERYRRLHGKDSLPGNKGNR